MIFSDGLPASGFRGAFALWHKHFRGSFSGFINDFVAYGVSIHNLVK
jgi:hypothetical protein